MRVQLKSNAESGYVEIHVQGFTSIRRSIVPVLSMLPRPEDFRRCNSTDTVAALCKLRKQTGKRVERRRVLR